MDDTDNGNIGQHQVNLEKAPEKARKTKPWGYWTLARCKKDALKYSSRTAWCRGSSSGYTTAARAGWLEQCCGHMQSPKKPMGYWIEARCLADAKKYGTLTAWRAASSAAVHAARKLGCFYRCVAHMDMRRGYAVQGYWNCLSRCKASALNYDCIKDWQRGEESAYQAARRNGWLAECTRHMGPGRACSDGDAVYVWRAVGQVAYGRRLYKIGVTSARLGARRIRAVAAQRGFTFAVKALAPVQGSAFKLEAKLLQLGKHPHWLEGDGNTEFRALTTAELGLALDMIAQAAV